MQPVVVIATHNRKEITGRNLKTLRNYDVVLVVSTMEEFRFYERKCYVVMASNFPLGKKWQAGVDEARKLDPSHIIITGSDDILSNEYIRTVIGCGFDFCGLQSWYVTDQKKLYQFDYLAEQPLGGGRCYSRSFLEKIDYRIFDVNGNRMLDDLGWQKVVDLMVPKCIFNTPDILAIKGNWPTMNPLPGHFRSTNAKLQVTYEEKLAKEIMLEKFNYEPW